MSEVSENGIYIATLVRGQTYTYKGATFRKGEGRKVTEATKNYFEENAFEDVSVGSGDDIVVERRAKFEFRPDGAPEPTPAARKRSRA